MKYLVLALLLFGCIPKQERNFDVNVVGELTNSREGVGKAAGVNLNYYPNGRFTLTGAILPVGDAYFGVTLGLRIF